MRFFHALTIGAFVFAASVSTGAAETKAEIPAGNILLKQIKRCWVRSVFQGNLYPVRIRVHLLPDGGLKGEPEVINPGRNRFVEQAALRSIRKCAPFKGLEPFQDTYAIWQEIVVGIGSR